VLSWNDIIAMTKKTTIYVNITRLNTNLIIVFPANRKAAVKSQEVSEGIRHQKICFHTKKMKDWGMTQVVDCLPCQHKTLTLKKKILAG
jgi:hypothetical protein